MKNTQTTKTQFQLTGTLYRSQTDLDDFKEIDELFTADDQIDVR